MPALYENSRVGRERERVRPLTSTVIDTLRSDLKWLWPVNTLVMQLRVEKVVFQRIGSTLRAS